LCAGPAAAARAGGGGGGTSAAPPDTSPPSPAAAAAAAAGGGVAANGHGSGGGGGGSPGSSSSRRANVWDFFRTVSAATSSMRLEAQLYKGIPSTGDGVQAWADARLGARGARFLTHIRGVELRRACCFALRENVLFDPTVDAPAAGGGGAPSATGPAVPPDVPPARHWALDERLALFYVFGRVTASADLVDDALSAAGVATGRPRAALRGEWEAYHRRGDAGDGRRDVARRLTAAAATRTENVGAPLVAAVTAVCTPGAIMELASLLSFLEMWRRLRLLYGLNELAR